MTRFPFHVTAFMPTQPRLERAVRHRAAPMALPTRLEARWRLDGQGRLYTVWEPIAGGERVSLEGCLAKSVAPEAVDAPAAGPSRLWRLIAACTSTLLSLVLATSVLFMVHGWGTDAPEACGPAPCTVLAP